MLDRYVITFATGRTTIPRGKAAARGATATLGLASADSWFAAIRRSGLAAIGKWLLGGHRRTLCGKAALTPL